jgi:hypothetical protein
MTKNTKTILLSLLACLLLITGFELGEGRIRFGSATLNDSSTVGLITMNKGLRVNGLMSSTDTIRTSGILRSTELQLTGASPQIYWTTYGMYIDGSIDALNYNANQHLFQTESATTLMNIDSATGVGQKVNTAGVWEGSLMKFKVVRGIAPTGNSTVIFAHGLDENKILGCTIWLRNDTAGTNGNYTDSSWFVAPNSSDNAALLYYAGFDESYAWARFPVAATSTRGDSLKFIFTYFD